MHTSRTPSLSVFISPLVTRFIIIQYPTLHHGRAFLPQCILYLFLPHPLPPPSLKATTYPTHLFPFTPPRYTQRASLKFTCSMLQRCGCTNTTIPSSCRALCQPWMPVSYLSSISSFVYCRTISSLRILLTCPFLDVHFRIFYFIFLLIFFSL